MMPVNTPKLKNIEGFTLIELVVVIIMIGILSATVIPKFFTSSGFEEVAYQAEVVTKLRSIQLRAMHQTGQAVCDINITEKELALVTVDDSTCNDINNTTRIVITEDDLSFKDEVVLSFDSLGRPNCGGCIISIQGGEQSKTVTINSEGYIYASN